MYLFFYIFDILDIVDYYNNVVISMKCLNSKCNANEIENDDNFCYKCGYYTSKGYSFLKDKENVNKITSGVTFKQNERLSVLFGLLAILVVVFLSMLMIRGEKLYKPFSYIKKQSFNYMYGYNTSLMKTDNKYSKESINSYTEAKLFIKNDFLKQEYNCFNDTSVDVMTNKLESDYSIPSVSFCDISNTESTKIKNVIDKMYLLFPNVKGALTNITITNASTKSEYIARFQPMYQFVNIDEDINTYNKVNKTQILLNSYYFLNEDIMKKDVESVVGKDYYVKDATWESTIAHEFGHYVSFVLLLKKNGIDNITFVTKDNESKINSVIEEFNSGEYSLSLLNEALNNYNKKYIANLNINEFASMISNYAATKDKEGKLIADETIAEAIHDYYLHGDNMNKASKEIISVISSKL